MDHKKSVVFSKYNNKNNIKTNIINQNIINAHDNNNNTSQRKHTGSKKAKKSNILTGKAAVEAIKNDPEVPNILNSEKSYFVTNRFIEQKEKETVTAEKHRLFNKQ